MPRRAHSARRGTSFAGDASVTWTALPEDGPAIVISMDEEGVREQLRSVQRGASTDR